MSYDANVLRRATQRLEEERRARSDRAARLRQEAYEKEPRLAQLDKKLQGTMSQLMAAALRRGESTAQAIQAIRQVDAVGHGDNSKHSKRNIPKPQIPVSIQNRDI